MKTQDSISLQSVKSVNDKAVEALTKANNANTKVDLTNQYFWHTDTDTGAGAGAHITQIPQEDFLADPTNGGGNTLIRSNGLIIRDGLTELAKFEQDDGTASITIGNDDGTESYMYADYHSIQMIDKEGDTYFYASDLRDRSGIATISETYQVGSGGATYTTQLHVYSVIGVWIGNTQAVEGTDYTRADDTFTFLGGAPQDTVKIQYTTQDNRAKAYTMGIRGSGTVGAMSVVEGISTAEGAYSHAEGNSSFADGYNSHAEGGATASGNNSHAEGLSSEAIGRCSHAEGFGSHADGIYSHAEGYMTVAKAYSHAEGERSQATGTRAHAEGSDTVASGNNSHSEGSDTEARGGTSHAEGLGAVAEGNYSHAQNYYTVAGAIAQTAMGKYNDNKSDTLLEVGNGTSDTARSNAFEVTTLGNLRIDLDTTATSGVDYEIYSALQSLGWDSDCII